MCIANVVNGRHEYIGVLRFVGNLEGRQVSQPVLPSRLTLLAVVALLFVLLLLGRLNDAAIVENIVVDESLRR